MRAASRTHKGRQPDVRGCQLDVLGPPAGRTRAASRTCQGHQPDAPGPPDGHTRAARRTHRGRQPNVCEGRQSDA